MDIAIQLLQLVELVLVIKGEVMKKFLLLLVFTSLSALGQQTATIVDTDGIAWSNGTWSAVLNSPNGAPTISRVPLTPAQQSAKGVLDSTGSFSATLVPTNSLDQSGATWQFTLTPNASSSSSSVVSTAITSATQPLSLILSTGISAPRFTTSATAYGYADIEVYPSPTLGSRYYNTNLNAVRTFGLTGWTTTFVGGISSASPAGNNGANSTLTVGGDTGWGDRVVYDGRVITSYDNDITQAATGNMTLAGGVAHATIAGSGELDRYLPNTANQYSMQATMTTNGQGNTLLCGTSIATGVLSALTNVVCGGFVSGAFSYVQNGVVTNLVTPAAGTYNVTVSYQGAGVLSLGFSPIGTLAGGNDYVVTGITPVTCIRLLAYLIDGGSTLGANKFANLRFTSEAVYTSAVPSTSSPGSSQYPQIHMLTPVGTIAVVLPPNYVRGKMNRWVLFGHGYTPNGGGTPPNTVNLFDTLHDTIFNALINAGYVIVVPEYTNINNFGNAGGVSDIAVTVSTVQSYFSLDTKPFVIGESMGGTVTLSAIGNGTLVPRAFVGIYPLTNINWIYNSGTSTNPPQAGINASIQTAYSCSNAATCNPVFVPYDPNSMSPYKFAYFPSRLWSSPSDTVVSKTFNSDLFARKVNAVGGNVIVTTTTGDHGDPSNFDPAAVVNFFNAN